MACCLVAMKIVVTFAIFAKFATLYGGFFTFLLYKSKLLVSLLFLLFIRYLLGCNFFVVFAMKFFVTFAFFADIFRFLQAVSINENTFLL